MFVLILLSKISFLEHILLILFDKSSLRKSNCRGLVCNCSVNISAVLGLNMDLYESVTCVDDIDMILLDLLGISGAMFELQIYEELSEKFSDKSPYEFKVIWLLDKFCDVDCDPCMFTFAKTEKS